MIQRTLAKRYELLELIGGGGMADVYKAHDVLLDRAVAVKILHQQYANDEEFVAKFRREATSAAKLAHPNIVNIYDVGEDGGSQYIVMEYVQGPTLKEVIQANGCLEPQQAVRLAKEIASALESAHRNNLVHCDIKPHNILVMGDGHIKVTDFGIARAVSASTMTYSGGVMGSVHYFSPEQAKGTVITAKSDVYSLGVVMYEMLTGQLPYNGETSISIALKHLQEEPVPIRQLKPSIPPVLEAIVQKSMSKDPLMRPSSTELFADLDQAKKMLADRMPGTEAAVQQDPFATQVIPRITPDMLSDHTGKAGQKNEYPQHQVNSYVDAGYDEEKADQQPIYKSKKFMLGMVAILVLGFFVGSFMSFGKFWSSAELDVPDVVGKPAAVAQQMLEDNNLRVKIVEANDDSVPAGQVISQYPEAGAHVKEQRLITITISKGGEEVSMPDLRGMSRSNAEDKLLKMGLKVSVYEEESDEAAGAVIKQDPRAGSKLTKGQTVDITVSKGKKKEITVQSYTGMQVENAKSNLEANGLKLGGVTEVPSTQARGVVISQSPAAGAVLQEGGTVSLTVSSGSGGNSGKTKTSNDAGDKDTGKQTDTSKLTIKTE